MHIIFLDTETTDLERARLVQLAYKQTVNGKVFNEYFQPPVPISYGAMATHHITNEMVANKPVFKGSSHHQELLETLKEAVVVAHNAPFDIQVLKNEGVEVATYIDTLRVARHLLKSEQYTLQYLRYFLQLNVVGAAHDALGDVLVLEALFNHLKKLVSEKFGFMKDHEAVEQMIALTQAPALLTSINFGKYRGKTYEDVSIQDRGYLEWLYGSETQKNPAEQNKEMVFTIKHYLKAL